MTKRPVLCASHVSLLKAFQRRIPRSQVWTSGWSGEAGCAERSHHPSVSQDWWISKPGDSVKTWFWQLRAGSSPLGVPRRGTWMGQRTRVYRVPRGINLPVERGLLLFSSPVLGTGPSACWNRVFCGISCSLWDTGWICLWVPGAHYRSHPKAEILKTAQLRPEPSDSSQSSSV